MNKKFSIPSKILTGENLTNWKGKKKSLILTIYWYIC